MLSNLNMFEHNKSYKKYIIRAWCKSGAKIPGPWDLGPVTLLKDLKVGRETP